MALQIKTLAALKSNALFKNVNESDLKQKVNQKDLINVNDGEIIFQAGDSAECIYLIIEGEVKIKHSIVYEGRRIFIKVKGDFFGEKEFLENTSRTSSAVAQTNTLLLSINRADFNNLAARNRTIMTNLQGIDFTEEEVQNNLPSEPVINEEIIEENTTEVKDLTTDTFASGTDEIIQQEILEEKTEIFSWDNLIDQKEEFDENVEKNVFTPSNDELKTSEETLDINWDFNFEETDKKEDAEPDEWDFSKIELEEKIELPVEDTFPAVQEEPIELADTPEIIHEEKELDYLKKEEPVKEETEDNELNREQLKLLIQAAEKVNSNIKIDDVLKSIVDAATSLTNADRGTLYVVDKDENVLWSKIIEGENIEEIRLKLGQGLAGWVAQTGEIINIKDATNDPRFDSEIDKTSGYKTKSMLCFPIKNRDGYIIGVLQLLNSTAGEFSDIDEKFLAALSIHVALALENASLVQQLLRTDRLTSLGKVAHFIINDMKKPILTIKSLVEHIKKKNVQPEIYPVLEMISDQASLVLDNVQTTLSYSEGKTILQTRVQTLHAMMDEILEMLAEFVESRNVKLFKKYGADCYINADKKELYQAFYQITKNACDAMTGGGNFYVTTSVENDFVNISFKDTGLGIPESLKERIFEPYMSQGKKQGVGLGLPIAEKIIKEHQGSISVESELGEGANFIISLPVYKK